MNAEQRHVLECAARLLAAQDRLRSEIRDNERQLRNLCREYDKHFGLWGSAPHHLRIIVENAGIKIA